jgi:hypothetical protein
MIRYYPKSKVKTNLTTSGNEYTESGIPYSGKYHLTFDGRAFSGPDPIIGPSIELTKIEDYTNAPGVAGQSLSAKSIRTLTKQAKLTGKSQSAPVPYYPSPLKSDYDKGYVIRYFVKRINQQGYVTEVSEQEYNSIKNGTADYDISMYQAIGLFWKLTGPLNQKRVSQYDIRTGIIDTNKRLVEDANKSFLGIKEFIGEKYDQFAKPTEK